jgi:superfamily II DNA or RNA helicase
VDADARRLLARELITWGSSFEAEARKLLIAIEELEARVRVTVNDLANETLTNDGHRMSWAVAPRFDLSGRSSATSNLATVMRRRERILSERGEAIVLARQVVADLDDALRAAKPAQSRLRMAFSRKATRAHAESAIDRLHRVRAWAMEQNVNSYFDWALAGIIVRPSDRDGSWEDVNRRPHWYARQLGADVGPRSDPIVPASDVRRACRLARELPIVVQATEAAKDSVRSSFDLVHAEMVRSSLAEVPLTRVKDVTAGRLRLGALESAGFANIQQILDTSPARLTLLPGVGDQTAGQVYAAAQQLAKAVANDLRFRINLDPTNQSATALVQALYAWDKLNQVTLAIGPDELPRVASDLAPLGSAHPPEEGLTIFLRRPGPPLAEIVRGSLGWVDQRDAWRPLDNAREILSGGKAEAKVAWDDFAHRSAEYYTLLSQLVDLTLDGGAEAGNLPEEIVAKVHAQPLDESLSRVSLRGYQSFGARFSLVQRRVIIGDEMGLGKTIQAIAVLAHLKSISASGRLLVVCPASVVVNWTREINERSALRVHRVHGFDRDRALKSWKKYGDVAVTTFDTLRAVDLDGADFALVVVDEAHFLKNAATQRSRNVRRLLARADRALFLTGTPLENRVDEFKNLVGFLQPSLVEGLDGSYVSPERFRQRVAPAYLRRNQPDVLAELPELVISDEWEEFSAEDLAAYRRAVAEGNFMAMRRAAFEEPRYSAKLARLKEIVDEAGANGHKIIVFSYFRDVLNSVAQSLRHAYGPLTGSVVPTSRQELVDRFAAAGDGAVLLSQIQAGGVGLNMQAGSVVIICEPQVKPTLEAQAIARAHRMGQVRGVQVHRLLTPEGVDQRLVELLDDKQRLFDEYVRRSDIANASPEAMDVSEATLAKTIIEQEQERLAMKALQELNDGSPEVR